MPSIEVGNRVNVNSRPGDYFHDFSGTVVRIREGVALVRDQDDDTFWVPLDQLEEA